MDNIQNKGEKKTRTVCCHVHLQPSWWGGRLRRLLNCLHPFSPIQTINRDAMSPTCPRLFSDNLPFPHHDYHCHQPNKNKKNKIQIISAFQTSGAYQCPEVPQVQSISTNGCPSRSIRKTTQLYMQNQSPHAVPCEGGTSHTCTGGRGEGVWGVYGLECQCEIEGVCVCVFVSFKREEANVLGVYQTQEHKKKSRRRRITYKVFIHHLSPLGPPRNTLTHKHSRIHTNEHAPHTHTIGPHVIVKSGINIQEKKRKTKTPQW